MAIYTYRRNIMCLLLSKEETNRPEDLSEREELQCSFQNQLVRYRFCSFLFAVYLRPLKSIES